EGKPIYSQYDIIGFAFALNEYEHDKGAAYPDVTTIIWDEFLSRGLYLTDEFVIFMNVISTIIRLRTDIQIWLLGNTVNKYCPIFQEMGLTNVLQMEQGTIDVYSYGNSGLKVAVEYCSSMAESKPNSYLFAFGNEKLQMITGGAWELDLFPHAPCKWQPKNIEFIYFIDFDNQLYQCEIVSIGEEFFTFIHEKTTPIQNPNKDLIFSLAYPTRLNHQRNILNPINKLGEKI
ncbi:phage DNA encapsidation protein, partial [Herbiconiux daphne]